VHRTRSDLFRFCLDETQDPQTNRREINMPNEISTYLKYANLQMAAEAFLNDAGETYKEQLTTGNNRTSNFTAVQANDGHTLQEAISTFGQYHNEPMREAAPC
jgi:hypothetical protein